MLACVPSVRAGGLVNCASAIPAVVWLQDKIIILALALAANSRAQMYLGHIHIILNIFYEWPL